MKPNLNRFGMLLAGIFVFVASIAWQAAVAEDVVHAVSGIVKSVDKGELRRSWSKPPTAPNTPSSGPTRPL